MAIPLTAIPSTPAITPSPSPIGAERAAGPSASGFGESLARLLESAEESSSTANSAVAHMVDGSGDVHDAMIALQRAELSLQLTVQVRNKLVQAYQDIMRMPV